MNSIYKDKITISAVSTKDEWFEPSLKALIYSKRLTGIKNVQLISNKKFNHPEVKCIFLDKTFKDKKEWNYFILKEYNQFIDTEFLLGIHDDGFVINSEAWTDEFLEYDYIGALWPQWDDEKRCGNGGFTLRSKKLLEVCEKYCPFIPNEPEDVTICRHHRDIFLNHGLKFCPNHLAVKFSIELPVKEAPGQTPMILGSLKSFGFHSPLWSPTETLKNNIII